MPSQFKIRPSETRDASALVGIFRASVQEIGARHYSADQAAAWAAAVPRQEDFERRAAEHRIFLVAEDVSGVLAAYGDLELTGHIDHLYCRPDVVGKGIGSALYNRLEEAARHEGIPFLYVDASEAAVTFFQHKGYQIRSRQDTDLNGVAIHNYRMMKWLT